MNIMETVVFIGWQRSKGTERTEGGSRIQGNAGFDSELYWWQKVIEVAQFLASFFILICINKYDIFSIIKGSSRTSWRHWRNGKTRRNCKYYRENGEVFFKPLNNTDKVLVFLKGTKGVKGYGGIPGFQGIKVLVSLFLLWLINF